MLAKPALPRSVSNTLPVAHCSVTFRQQLGAGDKDTISSILKWVVPQPQHLEKRAFVGYYLSLPDVRDCCTSAVMWW